MNYILWWEHRSWCPPCLPPVSPPQGPLHRWAFTLKLTQSGCPKANCGGELPLWALGRGHSSGILAHCPAILRRASPAQGSQVARGQRELPPGSSERYEVPVKFVLSLLWPRERNPCLSISRGQVQEIFIGFMIQQKEILAVRMNYDLFVLPELQGPSLHCLHYTFLDQEVCLRPCPGW